MPTETNLQYEATKLLVELIKADEAGQESSLNETEPVEINGDYYADLAEVNSDILDLIKYVSTKYDGKIFMYADRKGQILIRFYL